MISTTSDATRGCVFQIVHGSFVDGHGIRTTVFLKGCPLRCLWCCNPEGQEFHYELKLTATKCNRCGRCLDACAPGAISMLPSAAESPVVIDRNLCTNCGSCIDLCYTGALDFFGRTMTVEEVYEVLQRDEEYYKRSKGGVTIGGGEPTFQADFTYALMKTCQDNGIHVAIDTCGYTRTEKGLRILDEADLLLLDLKGMDPEEHQRNTGVSNSLIAKNLVRRGEMDGPMIIRMPLIPGYNDSRENLTRAAELLSRYQSVERVDLMPYHKFGTIKYEQLSRQYFLSGVEGLDEEYVEAIRTLFESYGLNTQIGG